MQDLAVVVLLMLIPLLAPSNGAPTGFSTIARALGIAAMKARTFCAYWPMMQCSRCGEVLKAITSVTMPEDLGPYAGAEAVRHSARVL